MNRETTNRIRFVLEDLIPPVIRDSFLFKAFAGLIWGGHVERLAKFRQRAPFLSEADYEALYRDHPRVHHDTDNSQLCIERIVSEARGKNICDVGCGTGALLRQIRDARAGRGRFTGVDFVDDAAAGIDGIEYVAARIEDLPFEDGAFDTVICTHVIEHVLDYRRAIKELRRICAGRLIIVVPREREYLYSFNPHFNFFPYTHSFLRAMHPVPSNHLCIDLGRDIYYREDINARAV